MSAPPTEAPSLLAALTRRPAVTAAVLLATTALGGLLPLARPQEPVARATLLLVEPATGPGGTDGRAYVRAQASVARLPLVSVLTAFATDAVHPGAGVDLRVIEQGLRVSLADGETGLVFRMRHPDPQVASYAADAAAFSYQRVRRARLRAEATATITRLDAVDRSLLALPADLRREQARAAVAAQRAGALVQQANPDVGIVAEVPAELDDGGVRRPLSLASGLLAGLVPALALGHRLQVRSSRRAALGVPTPASRLGAVRVGRGADLNYDVLASLLPPRSTVAVVSADSGPVFEQVMTELRRAAAAGGRRVLLTDPVSPRHTDASHEDLVLLAVAGVLGRGEALAAVRTADAALVVTSEGRHRLQAMWGAQQLLATIAVPVLAEVVVRRRLRLPPLRLPHRRARLRPPVTAGVGA